MNGNHCNKCNSSWTTGSLMTKCPFCGESIADFGDACGSDSAGKEPPFDNSGDALKYVMKKDGIDALLGDRLISYLSDYAPGLEKIRKNIISAVISTKASEILKANMKAGDSEKEAAFRRAVRRVVDDYGTDEKIVHGIVSEFTAALGWEINIKMPEINTNTSSGNISSGNTDNIQQSVTQPVLRQTLTVGQRDVKFGKYNWRVLDVQGGKALLLLEDIVEKRKYHDSWEDVTWEKCDLRKYLNGEFKNNFSSDEQKRIVEVVNKNPNNQWHGTSGGRDTRDSIFLLSIEEVVKYFGDSGQLKNRPGIKSYIDDQYNEARIAKYNGEECWWWLRSPGFYSFHAVGVNSDGSIIMNGDHVDRGVGGLRPALWINLS